jgi:hypothetical protein
MSDGVAAELFAYGFTRAAFLNWTPPADGFHFEASAGEWPKNSDVIYVLADVESNRVLFVGHTGRARKRSENLASWLNGKSSDTPIRAAWLECLRCCTPHQVESWIRPAKQATRADEASRWMRILVPKLNTRQ